jgi:hypothetical protein
MTDKIQDRLLKASRYEVRKEAADYIDKLEAVVEHQWLVKNELRAARVVTRIALAKLDGETSDNRAKENDDD